VRTVLYSQQLAGWLYTAAKVHITYAVCMYKHIHTINIKYFTSIFMALASTYIRSPKERGLDFSISIGVSETDRLKDRTFGGC
jgi:hypothetical protein